MFSFLVFWLEIAIEHFALFHNSVFDYTIDSRYLEFQGTFGNTSRYPYFDISDLQNRGKTISINHI